MQFKFIFMTLFLVMTMNHSIAGSYLNWTIDKQKLKIDGKLIAEIRMGFLEENKEKKFQGNILYFEGLGDSMLNHDPLFESLIESGFRIISFDYMGQGGSSGKMNNTTIENITKIGDFVVNKYAREDKNGTNSYHIIGWSTGGLAAYRKAVFDKNNLVKSITLLAPGIAPNYLVGEGLLNWPIDEITLRTLTNNRFENRNDPHEDPIHPNTPMVVPKFAINLQHQAKLSRLFWNFPKSTPGLVLLSGTNDTYVNAKKTKKALKRNASHFQVKTYPLALHEIDNEIEAIAVDVRKTILRFLINQ